MLRPRIGRWGGMLGKESMARAPPLLRKTVGPRAVPEPSPASPSPADLQHVHPHGAVVLYHLLSQEPVGSEIQPSMLLGFEQSWPMLSPERHNRLVVCLS